ncbi:MAG: Mov34/MPN/PAD-1 family protein [Myxococcota bacterium]
MRRRIEVSAEAEPLAIPGRVLNELCAHALEAQPEECCGLLTGTGEDRFRTVYRCRNDMTMRHRTDPTLYPRDGREAFYMSETDWMRALADAERRGEEVTGVYHSHVGADAYLSEMDQAFLEHDLFPFPNAAQLVIGVWERKVSRVGVFERPSPEEEFVGRAVEALP